MKVTGQQIKDALELGASAYPGESGGFLQVSGLTYTIDSTIPSSVVRDEKNMFVKVDGAYRVSDIQVGGQPLDVNKTYTLASHNYMLKSQGDGYAMFGTDNVEIVKDCVMIDNQVLINYIVNELDGTVGKEYAAPEGRITIVTASAEPEQPAEPEKPVEPAKPVEPEKPAESGIYTVAAGDCLWSIAQKTYGTGTKWGVIYEANKATVKDPGMIYIGQVLTIPAA